MVRNDSLLSASVKDQADLTWLLVEAVDSGLLQGATELGVAQVRTILSELGTNIIKYAGRGTLRLERVEAASAIDILIKAEDQGPGIADIDLAMQDAYSTGNSLGLGLPSVRRLADSFSLSSAPGQGTVVEVRKRIRAPHPQFSAMDRLSASLHEQKVRTRSAQSLKSPQFELGCATRPYPGEVVSGDLVHVQPLPQGLLLAVADVSGHGAKAGALADQIQEYLASKPDADIHRLMANLHERLRGTLGAALALLHVDLQTGQLDFCAVGNVTAQRVVGDSWRPISKDGVLGQRLPTLIRQGTRLRNGDLILVCTDGVSELAARQLAAQGAHRPAEQLATELVTRLGRPFDDASCVVFKWIA